MGPLCEAVRLLQLDLFSLRNEEQAYEELLRLVAEQVGCCTAGAQQPAICRAVYISYRTPSVIAM